MIDYTQYGRVYVELHNDNSKYYACCNFIYKKDIDGITPTDMVHVYLLHPADGSIVTLLTYNPDIDMYLIRDNHPQLDTIDLDTISEKLKEYKKNMK